MAVRHCVTDFSGRICEKGTFYVGSEREMKIMMAIHSVPSQLSRISQLDTVKIREGSKLYTVAMN